MLGIYNMEVSMNKSKRYLFITVPDVGEERLRK